MNSLNEQNTQFFMENLFYLPIISRAVYAAAELEISDILIQGEKSIDELAEETKCNKESLYSLLRLLACYDLYGEDKPGIFHLKENGKAITTQGFGDAFRLMTQVMWNSIGNLLSSIRTGKIAFQDLMGMDYYQFAKDNPDEFKKFNKGMANFSTVDNSDVVSLYDFSEFNTIVDVAGGRGYLLTEILKKNPLVQGILYDLSTENPDEYLVSDQVKQRCKLVTGDFLQSVPKGGDVYILKRVIEDWDDESCIQLLKNCRNAMNKSGVVLTIDGIIPDVTDYKKRETELLNVGLMIFSGGLRREREYKELYQKAGLKVTKIIKGSGTLDIIQGEYN